MPSYNSTMKTIQWKDNLINRQRYLSKIIDALTQRLSVMPCGKLRIDNNYNKTYYYLVQDGETGNGIKIDPQDFKLITSLAQKAYYQKVLKSAQVEKNSIERFLSRYPNITFEDIPDSLTPDRRRLISPIVLPDEEYKQRWLQEAYEPMGFDEGDPYYQTQKGLRVRSKSEMLIAERLDAKGIPYKYEYPVELQYRTVHPDFKILRLSDRKELYYEHLGKMDDPAYAQKNVKKLREYALNGYTIGDNLFLTMETSVTPLDMRVVDKMIDEHFR